MKTHRFRYTYTVEIDVPCKYYPEDSDPLEIEKQQSETVILLSIEDGKGTFNVEQIR